MKLVNKTKLLLKFFAICLISTFILSKNVSAKTVTLNKNSSFATVNSETVNKNTYSSTQGMCKDTEGNFYYAKIVPTEDNIPTKCVKIYKLDKNGNNRKCIATDTEGYFGHANDMAYVNGYLYIATHSNSNKSADVIRLKVSNGERIKLNYEDSEKKAPTGIAYDKERNIFYLKSGSNIQPVKFNRSKNRIQLEGSPIKLKQDSTWTSQGFTYYNNCFYAAYSINKNKQSIIAKYNSNGERISYNTYSNTSSPNLFEIESLYINSAGNMYFITNSSPDLIYKMKY